MASPETRPRSKCNPKKDATALFISRAKDASVGGGGARLGGGCGAGGDGVAAGGAATVKAAQASGAFIDDEADDCTGSGLFAAAATRCSTRTGGGASGFGRFFTTGGGGGCTTGLRFAALLAASATASAGATWPLSKASLALRFFARHSASLSTHAPRNEAGQDVHTLDSSAAATFVADACCEPPNAANNK